MNEKSEKRKLRIFIGCSKEAIEWAEPIQTNLNEWCHPEIFSQNFFDLSRNTLENLETRLPDFDAAIFLWTPDDATISRGKKSKAARDNIIFETGLSIGIFGRLKTFIVQPKAEGLKFPTDLLGLTTGRYAADAPNKQAALAPFCRQVRESLEKSTASHSIASPKSLSEEIVIDVHPRYQNDIESILNRFQKMAFSKGVIRRNWIIELTYDFSRINDNLILETIVWDYEFINITNGTIDYSMTLFSIDDNINDLVSFTKDDGEGGRISIFESQNTTEKRDGIFLTRRSAIKIPPTVSHFITMQFVFTHPVSPESHYIHNAFAPLDPTLSARLVAHIPEGYCFDILATEPVEPTRFENRWDFRIPGPLMPEQIIEYIFQKDGK